MDEQRSGLYIEAKNGPAEKNPVTRHFTYFLEAVKFIDDSDDNGGICMKRRALEVRFQSDLYIGSGTGIPGSIDSQLLRDTVVFPYIQSKTLLVILRDASEWVADMRAVHVVMQSAGAAHRCSFLDSSPIAIMLTGIEHRKVLAALLSA